MATNDSRVDSQNDENALKRIDWFGVCYWAAAGVQVVGSFNVFGAVGGSPLHAVAGALCVELLILALNSYGAKQSGKWMAIVCMASLVLIGASAMFQVADLLSHKVDAELAAKFGAGLYGALRVTIPIAPSVAMAVVTLIKFVDAKRNQGVPLDEQLAATEHQLQQVNANLAGVVERNREVLARNERLQSEHDALVAQLERERVQHQDELREVARLATAQRVVQSQAQLPSGGMTWEQGVDALKKAGVPVGATTLGEIVGKHKSTAGRWLAQHPEAQQ
jgi:regulator of replication initiation timing